MRASRLANSVAIYCRLVKKATLKLQPARRFDLGAGNGGAVEAEVTGGIVGLVIDTRGRPLEIPTDSAQRVCATHKMADRFGYLSPRT